MNEVDLKVVLSDYYDSMYGIFQHGKEHRRPFSTVAMFPSENFTERSTYYDSILEFGENGYHELWGLNLTEFLNLPQYLVKMIRSITQEIRKKKLDIANEVQKQVEQGAARRRQ